MRGEKEPDDTFEYEVERRNPIEVSQEYYYRGMAELGVGLMLDGLVNLHLSKDHLVGAFGPKNPGINRKQYPLIKTLEELDIRIAIARARLRSYGPVRRHPQLRIVKSDADIGT